MPPPPPPPSAVGRWVDYGTFSVPLPSPAISDTAGHTITDNRGLFVLHAVLMHTGKVLVFSGHAEYAHYATESYVLTVEATAPNHTLERVSFPAGIDLFCCHYVQIADGKILAVGGSDPDFQAHGSRGARTICTFDPDTKVWERKSEYLAQGRWYPTAVLLGDGRVLVFSGRRESNPLLTSPPANIADAVEVIHPPDFQPHYVTGGATLRLPLYPGLHLAPNGRIYYTHTNWGLEIDDVDTRSLEMTGETTGAWTPYAGRRPNQPRREEGMSVLLPPASAGKILVVGGSIAETDVPPAPLGTAPHTPAVRFAPPANFFVRVFGSFDSFSSEILDTTVTPPTWTNTTGAMSQGRTNGHLVLLPDRSVLVCGGHDQYKWRSIAGNTNPSLETEAYQPASQTFEPRASLNHPRMYHSVALLLPDGRVLAAGGADPNGTEPLLTYPSGWNGPRYELGYPLNRKDFEVFEPPYMHSGPRPKIDGVQKNGVQAPQMLYGETFQILTTQAASIRDVALMRPGAPTHHTDTEQRYVELDVHVGHEPPRRDRADEPQRGAPRLLHAVDRRHRRATVHEGRVHPARRASAAAQSGGGGWRAVVSLDLGARLAGRAGRRLPAGAARGARRDLPALHRRRQPRLLRSQPCARRLAARAPACPRGRARCAGAPGDRRDRCRRRRDAPAGARARLPRRARRSAARGGRARAAGAPPAARRRPACWPCARRTAMPAEPGSFERIATALSTALEPLATELQPENAMRFLGELGLYLGPDTVRPELEAALGATATAATRLSDLAGELVSAVESGAEAVEIIAKSAPLAAQVVVLIESVDTIATELGRVGAVPGLDPADLAAFVADLPVDLLHRMLVEHLEREQPSAVAVLALLGIVERTRLNVGSTDPLLPEVTRKPLRLDRLGTLIESPGSLVHELYDWGETTLDGAALIERLSELLAALRLPVARYTTAAPERPALQFPLATLAPTTGLTPQGLEGQIVGALAEGWTLLIPLGNGLELEFSVGGSVAAAVGVRLQSPAVFTLIPPSGSVQGTLSAGVNKTPVASASAFTLLGVAGGSRLEAQLISGAIAAEFAWSSADGSASGDFGVDGRVQGGKLVISLAGADGFIGELLGGFGLESDFDLGVGWRAGRRRLLHAAAATLEIQLPAHVDARAGRDRRAHAQRRHRAAATFPIGARRRHQRAQLGPLAAVVEQIGVARRR